MASQGYAVVWSISENSLELVGIDIAEGLALQLPDLFDLSLAFLSSQCTIFEFDTSSLSEENPVLPVTIGPSDTLFQYPQGLIIPEHTYYLYYWDFQRINLPAGAIPGVDATLGYAHWEYRKEPPQAQYIAPYEQYKIPYEDGQIWVSRYSPLGNYEMELLYQHNDDIGNQSHVIRDRALWIHELEQTPDWSDYEVVRPPSITNFYFQADTILPDQPSYQGQYPWDNDDLAPHLDSAQYYDPDRYFVWLQGCEVERWKPCFEHPDRPDNSPFVPLIVGGLLIEGAVDSLRMARLGNLLFRKFKLVAKRERRGMGFAGPFATGGIPFGVLR